jgi:hypothetical protein
VESTGFLIGMVILWLLIAVGIGTVYWAANRERVGYREAIGAPWVLVTALAVAIVWSIVYNI